MKFVRPHRQNGEQWEQRRQRFVAAGKQGGLADVFQDKERPENRDGNHARIFDFDPKDFCGFFKNVDLHPVTGRPPGHGEHHPCQIRGGRSLRPMPKRMQPQQGIERGGKIKRQGNQSERGGYIMRESHFFFSIILNLTAQCLHYKSRTVENQICKHFCL